MSNKTMRHARYWTVGMSIMLLSSMLLATKALESADGILTTDASSENSSRYDGADSEGAVVVLAVPPELVCDASDIVLVIQDNVPWNILNDPLGAVVEEMRLREKLFCMINSDQIGATNLNQFGEIIISAAQAQSFYDNLFPGGTIHPSLVTFVANGGILSANLTDCASGPGAGGTWATEICNANDTTSFSFIGGLKHVMNPSLFFDNNDIASPSHPIVRGAFGAPTGGEIVDIGAFNDLDNWDFSSHGFFISLPPGTTVILNQPDITGDGLPEPVMIQYPFGNGQVIATLTTTEFRYVGGLDIDPKPVNKKLLANEIGFQDEISPKPPTKITVKTIFAQKESFEIQQDGIPLIADVTIIAEIFESLNTQSLVKKQVAVVTCITEPLHVRMIECRSRVPSPTPVLVQNCHEEPVSKPQRLNTVTKKSISNDEGMNTVVAFGIVKTIYTQTEIFLCDIDNDNTDDTQVNTVLFTEIWEDLNRLRQNPPTDPVLKKTFESLTCYLDINTGSVTSCIFQTLF